MLSKKFEGRKSIWFSWVGEVSGLESAEIQYQQSGESVYGMKAADFQDANRIDEILAKDGREYAVRG